MLTSSRWGSINNTTDGIRVVDGVTATNLDIALHLAGAAIDGWPVQNGWWKIKECVWPKEGPRKTFSYTQFQDPGYMLDPEQHSNQLQLLWLRFLRGHGRMANLLVKEYNWWRALVVKKVRLKIPTVAIPPPSCHFRGRSHSAKSPFRHPMSQKMATPTR